MKGTQTEGSRINSAVPELTAKQVADRERRQREKEAQEALEAENLELRRQLAEAVERQTDEAELGGTPELGRDGRGTPKLVHTQTAPSSSLSLAKLDRVNWHYVKVPHTPSFPDEIIKFDEYTDKSSPSNPKEPMYEVVSMGDTPEGRRLTGSAKMALLRCSMEDKIAEMKQLAKDAGAKEKLRDPETAGRIRNNIRGQQEEFESLEGGVTLSI